MDKFDFKHLFVIAILILAGCFFCSEGLCSTFNISYSLTEGGERLELNATNPYKGVNIQVANDTGLRYEVYQKIIQPITNRDNRAVQIGDNLTLRGIMGTNRYGQFRLQTNDLPMRSLDTLYISDNAGDADSFTIVYGYNNTSDLPAGEYQGQVAFVLRPVGGTLAEVTQYLYIYVTVKDDTSRDAQPVIELVPASGSRAIMLNPNKEELRSCDFLVKINGSFKKFFSIKQSLYKPLESNEGARIPEGLITIETSVVKKGVNMPPLPLSDKPQDIYASGQNGEADESFVITYKIKDAPELKAGKYSSTMRYYLDVNGVPTTIDSLDMRVECEPVFDLMLTSVDQKGKIEFLALKPQDGPKQDEVIVEVRSNTGKQYQVTQNILAELTDKQGNVIPSRYFKMYTQAMDTKGQVKINQGQEAKKGETILFVSDAKGSSDKFRLIYELAVPADIKGGDYSTNISYSLVEK